jgi:hypothetical protein
VILIMKKSPKEMVSVEGLAKVVAVSKFAVLAPDAYLTILLIVDPLSVLVKLVVKPPAASAAVRVASPADAEPSVAFGVPRVGVTPLMLALESVAISEATKEETLQVTVAVPSPPLVPLVGAVIKLFN